MGNRLQFKIYNKNLNKSFKVTRIDYIDNIIYYFDKDKEEEDIISFDDSILLMPTGLYDCCGREIFEGDVITYQENSFTYKKIAEVIFQDGCFMTKQIFNKTLEIKAKSENLIDDNFTDLLCLATLSVSKPLKIIGNIFTYKPSKNSCKIKIEI